MEKTILRFLTAGSVDDGKSSFLGRLLFDSNAVYEDHLREVEKASNKSHQDFTDLSLLVDGLESERNQKITIDAAYRYFSTEGRKFIIADSPGHEEYTRNMAVAASNCDAAVILIDAARGIKNQSLRHSYIAYLFGIRQFIIAINKMDLVDYDPAVFQRIRTEFKERSKSFLGDAPMKFVPISARAGDNIVHLSDKTPWYSGKTILNLLETMDSKQNNFVETRFMVQNVAKNEDQRYFQGRLTTGSIKLNQEVIATPSNKKTVITEIIHSGKKVSQAGRGNSISISLADEIDLERGSVISDVTNNINNNDEFDATIVWFRDQPLNISNNQEFLIKINHNMVNTVITKLNYLLNIQDFSKESSSNLRQNDIANIRLKLSKNIAFDLFKDSKFSGSFLLIDKVSNETLACGVVTNNVTTQAADNFLSSEEKYRNFVNDVLKLGEKHFGIKLSLQ